MDKQQKAETIKEFARTEHDVGSVEVQVAILTKRVAELTEHLKTHRKDHGSRRGLIAMVNKRRKLLNYLNRRSHPRYLDIIRRLKLRR